MVATRTWMAGCWLGGTGGRPAISNVSTMLAPLNDADTALCVRAERAVSRALGGSCTLPLGAYARLGEGRLSLDALVASADGRRVLRARATGTNPEEVGAQAARALREQGADAILGALK